VVRRFTDPTMASTKQVATRAVGQALKRNPFAPVVPCHRVVRSDGSLGGFNGCTSGCEIDRKIKLLAQEGVTFANEQKVIAKSHLLM
jgi:methylated-DNA-[protein]-cysteine S-methyltransferase